MDKSYYMYDFENFQIDEYVLHTIGICVLIFALVLILVGLVSYILTAVAYSKISKRRGIKAGWLSWIPVLRYYIYGRVANEYDKRNGVNRKWHIALLLLAILSISVTVMFSINMFDLSADIIEPVIEINGTIYDNYEDYEADIAEIIEDAISNSLKIGVLNAAGTLISVLLTYLFAVCLYKTFESTVPKAALFCFIISILVPLACPICLFVCRNKGYEYKVITPPVQQAAPPVQQAVQPMQTTVETPASAETTQQ